MKYGSKIHFQKMLKKESHAKIGNILQFKLRIKIKIFPTCRKKRYLGMKLPLRDYLTT